jgi:hypothetical protein
MARIRVGVRFLIYIYETFFGQMSSVSKKFFKNYFLSSIK